MFHDHTRSNAGFSIMDAMIGLSILSIGLLAVISEVRNQSALETKNELATEMIDMEDLFRAALTRRYATAVEKNCATIKPVDLVQGILPAPWTNKLLTPDLMFKFNAEAPKSFDKAVKRCNVGSSATDGTTHVCALFERAEPGLPKLKVLLEGRLEPRNFGTGAVMPCAAFLEEDVRGIAGVYGMFVESRLGAGDFVYHNAVGQILSGSQVE